jgi:hypothetical protein
MPTHTAGVWPRPWATQQPALLRPPPVGDPTLRHEADTRALRHTHTHTHTHRRRGRRHALGQQQLVRPRHAPQPHGLARCARAAPVPSSRQQHAAAAAVLHERARANVCVCVCVCVCTHAVYPDMPAVQLLASHAPRPRHAHTHARSLTPPRALARCPFERCAVSPARAHTHARTRMHTRSRARRRGLAAPRGAAALYVGADPIPALLPPAAARALPWVRWRAQLPRVWLCVLCCVRWCDSAS